MSRKAMDRLGGPMAVGRAPGKVASARASWTPGAGDSDEGCHGGGSPEAGTRVPLEAVGPASRFRPSGQVGVQHDQVGDTPRRRGVESASGVKVVRRLNCGGDVDGIAGSWPLAQVPPRTQKQEHRRGARLATGDHWRTPAQDFQAKSCLHQQFRSPES